MTVATVIAGQVMPTRTAVERERQTKKKEEVLFDLLWARWTTNRHVHGTKGTPNRARFFASSPGNRPPFSSRLRASIKNDRREVVSEAGQELPGMIASTRGRIL